MDLKVLYKSIKECHICPRMDSYKALRLINAVDPESDVFIISQSLAENQLRKSGVNFFQKDGELGNTGVNLEKFLNKFNRTVYPYQEIKLENGNIIPNCNPGYKSVYNTEIAQCYPGKRGSGKGDRPPTSDEIRSCLNQRFLFNEIRIMKPKILLLMGQASWLNFYKHVLGERPSTPFSETILNIIRKCEIPKFRIDENEIFILPIQHASGANPRFHSMVKNETLIELIKNIIT